MVTRDQANSKREEGRTYLCILRKASYRLASPVG